LPVLTLRLDVQNGAVDVGVAAETDYHMEAVLAAPRLADLDSLLPVRLFLASASDMDHAPGHTSAV